MQRGNPSKYQLLKSCIDVSQACILIRESRYSLPEELIRRHGLMIRRRPGLRKFRLVHSQLSRSNKSKGAVRCELLEGLRPVREPDPEVDVGMSLEDRGVDGAHPADRDVAQQNGEVAAVDRRADVAGGLGTARTGAVVTPVGDVGAGVDEGELELPGPVVGLPARGDLPGVGDERGRSLSADGGEQEGQEGREGKYTGFHGWNSTVFKLLLICSRMS